MDDLLFLLQSSEPTGSRNTDYEVPENNESGSIELIDSCNSEPENHRNDEPKEVESDPALFKKPNHSKKCIKKNYVTPLQEAVTCMKSHASSRDEYTVFGELIANKLRNCNRPNLEIALAEHKIHSVILLLEMGMYADQVQTTATSYLSTTGQPYHSDIPTSCVSSPAVERNREHTDHGVHENMHTYLNTLTDL